MDKHSSLFHPVVSEEGKGVIKLIRISNMCLNHYNGIVEKCAKTFNPVTLSRTI
jgi:hypothetical protein